MVHSILLFCPLILLLSTTICFKLPALDGRNLTSESKNPTPVIENQATVSQEFSPSVLQASALASQVWLNLLDTNKYAESWDRASSLTKLTVKKDEWIQILERSRRPLGSVTSRQVVDQRTAKDPNAMPKGDYIVMFYKTVFAHKTAFELITLYLEDGQWRVLTYQVDNQ